MGSVNLRQIDQAQPAAQHHTHSAQDCADLEALHHDPSPGSMDEGSMEAIEEGIDAIAVQGHHGPQQRRETVELGAEEPSVKGGGR